MFLCIDITNSTTSQKSEREKKKKQTSIHVCKHMCMFVFGVSWTFGYKWEKPTWVRMQSGRVYKSNFFHP